MPGGARAAAPPAPSARPEDASAPDDVAPEPATLHSLAVRWPVRGDANANASVAVEYRPAGETRWRAAYPLFRPHPELQSAGAARARRLALRGKHRGPHAGHRVRGARSPSVTRTAGDAERLLRLRTAAEPRGAAGDAGAPRGARRGRRLRVATSEPFRGLAAAEAQAAPGDLFLLHAGVYRAAPWHVQRQGARGRPIIYRGAGDGAAILDGGGGERVVSAPGARHVWLGGRHPPGRALSLSWGTRAAHLVVRRVRFEVTRVGIRGDQRRLYGVARVLHHRQRLHGAVAVAALAAASSPSTPSRSRAPGT